MEIIKQFAKERGNLIPILQKVQYTEKYIKPETIKAISTFLGISENDIYSVISFYPDFKLVQPAKHCIKVCQCLSCRLNGSETIMQILQHELELLDNQDSQDSKIYLESTILSACSNLSPIVIFNGDIYARMTPTGIKEILSKFKS